MNMTKQYETLTTTYNGLMHCTVFVRDSDCVSQNDAFNQALEKAQEFLKFPVLCEWNVSDGESSCLQENPYRNKRGDYVFLFAER